jgi:aarF domain-containing kinase
VVQVDIDKFADDLGRLFMEIRNLDSEVGITASPDLGTVSASVTVDNAQINRLLLEIVRVGEVHGIRFPRYEYFCRHSQALPCVA